MGQLRPGLEDIFRPGVQLVHRDGPGGHILPAGLVDAHAHLSDVVEGVKQPERAQGIQHHLGILLGLNQNALAVLEVDDVEQLVRHDDAVPGAEAFRDPAGEVQPLLDEDQRVGALKLGLGELLQYELHIAICVSVHLITVILGHRLTGAHLQSAAELVFAESVGGGAFGSGLRLPVGKLPLQTGGGGTVHPTVGTGGGEDGVAVRWHGPTPPHPSTERRSAWGPRR